MKTKTILTVVFVCCFEAYFTAFATNDTIRFASYNIRVDSGSDTGNRAWSKRKGHVADIIKNLYQFDILGVQEIKSTNQQSDLMHYLSDAYNIFAKGRDNTAGTTGERNAIIFKTSRFQPLGSGFFFLSETPETAGIGWDAKFNRNCLWLKLRDLNNDSEFYFFCTHFDHVGAEARRQSANLIINKIKEINKENLPVVLVGDLNIQPDKIPIANILKGGLLDSRSIVAASKITGPVGTTNGWNKAPANMTNRIDYIFVNDQVNVLSYATVTQKYFSDAYPSDHCPITIQALLSSNTTVVPDPEFRENPDVPIISENFSSQAWENEFVKFNPTYTTPQGPNGTFVELHAGPYFEKYDMFSGAIEVQALPESGLCDNDTTIHKYKHVAVSWRLKKPELGDSWITLPKVPHAGRFTLHVKSAGAKSSLKLQKVEWADGKELVTDLTTWDIASSDNLKFSACVDELKTFWVNSRDSITLRVGQDKEGGKTFIKIFGFEVAEHLSVNIKNLIDSADVILIENIHNIGDEFEQYSRETYDALSDSIQVATTVYNNVNSSRSQCVHAIYAVEQGITNFFSSVNGNNSTGLFSPPDLQSIKQNGRIITTNGITDISVYNAVGMLVLIKKQVQQIELPSGVQSGLYMVKTPIGIKKVYID